MKFYPSISYHPPGIKFGNPCIAFNKYDGSNLRFEWSRKRGWWKFGTRNHLFDRNDVEYGSAIDIFMNKYADGIEKVIIDDKKYHSSNAAIAFAEFFGPHSFAGQHDLVRLKVENNDPKDLVLFDINIHKKGILGPREFLDGFAHLDVAKVIYEGPYCQELIDDVLEGKYPVVEGAIAKGGSGHKLWMAKIKTREYKNKLISFFENNWQDYW